MGIVSPSTEAYQVGLGACYFRLDGESEFRHVGNVPEMTYSADVTKLTHNQSMSGIQSVDWERVTAVNATINMVLEEVTKENIALFAMGAVETNSDGDPEIGGLTLTTLEGDFRYVGANDYGPQLDFEARVSITPNGEFNFISTEINRIPLTATVLQSNSRYGTWTVREQTSA